MAGITLDEEAIDEVLYLARANEVSELESYLAELATQTKHAKADLVAAAVDPYSKNTALHYAAANGHIDVMKLLLSYNTTGKAAAPASGLINAVNDAANTPLHWAALNGRLDIVKQLIHSGADVTLINKAGHDAVFEAEINDKKDVVEWLLGAVEELEKGVGGEGEDKTHTGQEESKDQGGSSTSDVDNVTKQMEGIQTRDGTTQGG